MFTIFESPDGPIWPWSNHYAHVDISEPYFALQRNPRAQLSKSVIFMDEMPTTCQLASSSHKPNPLGFVWKVHHYFPHEHAFVIQVYRIPLLSDTYQIVGNYTFAKILMIRGFRGYCPQVFSLTHKNYQLENSWNIIITASWGAFRLSSPIQFPFQRLEAHLEVISGLQIVNPISQIHCNHWITNSKLDPTNCHCDTISPISQFVNTKMEIPWFYHQNKPKYPIFNMVWS